MKKLKKLFAVLLTLTMVLGMTATVFAETDGDGGDTGNATTPNPEYRTEEGNGTAEDKGTIAVKGIEGTDATVTAYKIIKANYANKFADNSMRFSGYESLYKSVYDVTNGVDVNLSASKVSEFVTAVTEDPSAIGIPMTYVADKQAYMPNTDEHKVEIGTYLVIVQPTNTMIYNPMVISVSYANTDEALNIKNTVLDITSTTTWAKVSSTPTIDKTAKKDAAVVKSVNIGDVVDYEIVVSPIPFYSGLHPVFRVEDTLSTGLTIDSTSVKVYVVENKDAVASITDTTAALASGKYATPIVETVEGGQKLTVNFVTQGGYQLNDNAYVGKTLVIKYKATVTDKTAINYDPYTNTATLKYTKNSDLDEDEGTPDPEDEPKSTTYNYTFDLSGIASGDISKTTSLISKTGELTEGEVTEETELLSGAEFTLYMNEACTEAYTASNSHIPEGKITSGTDGVLAIRGLAEGNYWLKETKAPAGYSLNETPIPIVIAAQYYGENEENKGQLKSWTITVDGVKIIEGNVADIKSGNQTTVSVLEEGEIKPIVNTKLSTLPSTGGIGTTIFTLGGCALMILAAGLYFATRRKTAK